MCNFDLLLRLFFKSLTGQKELNNNGVPPTPQKKVLCGYSHHAELTNLFCNLNLDLKGQQWATRAQDELMKN